MTPGTGRRHDHARHALAAAEMRIAGLPEPGRCRAIAAEAAGLARLVANGLIQTSVIVDTVRRGAKRAGVTCPWTVGRAIVQGLGYAPTGPPTVPP